MKSSKRVLLLGHMGVINELLPACDEELSRNRDLQDIPDMQELIIRPVVT